MSSGFLRCLQLIVFFPWRWDSHTSPGDYLYNDIHVTLTSDMLLCSYILGMVTLSILVIWNYHESLKQTWWSSWCDVLNREGGTVVVTLSFNAKMDLANVLYIGLGCRSVILAGVREIFLSRISRRREFAKFSCCSTVYNFRVSTPPSQVSPEYCPARVCPLLLKNSFSTYMGRR